MQLKEAVSAINSYFSSLRSCGGDTPDTSDEFEQSVRMQGSAEERGPATSIQLQAERCI